MTTTNTPEFFDTEDVLAVAPVPQNTKSGIAAIAGRFMLMAGALLVATDHVEAQQGRGRGRQSAAVQSQTNPNQQRGSSAAEQDWKYTIEQINGQTYAVYTGMTVNELLLLKQSRDNLTPQAQKIVDKAMVVTARNGKQHPAFLLSGQLSKVNTPMGSRMPGLNAAAPLNKPKKREDETLADAKQGANAMGKETDLKGLKTLGIRCFQTISAELDEAAKENPDDVRDIRAGFSQLVITTDIEESEALYREINSLLTHSSNLRMSSHLDIDAVSVVAARVREIMAASN